ncbi:PREDICTED: uncharacterized protein LOC105567748 [Vollenhovia emeryi]|uniref:uncharacterized protein LOC105567748 n=1 Tax=Vollenhovia emeryi TaxID=411798 RepID=UPI0005F4B091|nr:PREDICTED: uncharacterized protein LOC105567748 [Vollenhovia emeryi]
MTISRIDGQPDSRRKERQSTSSSMRHCKRSSDVGDDGVRRFHGDGLVVEMHSNHHALEITGDGCQIVLSNNSGSVHVIGDGCRLRVSHNVGNIEYTGDGGQVLLGPGSSKGKVKFVGEGGRVIFDSGPETDPKRPAKEPRDGETYVRSFISPCKETIGKVPECGGDRGTLSREDLDNVLNDAREKSRGKYGKRNEETLRKSFRHPTVTKIITKIQSDGQCVTKRFGDSSLIVNSRGRPAARSVPRTTSATSVG